MRWLFARPFLLLVLTVVGWWFLQGTINAIEDSLRQAFGWMFP